MTLANIMIFPVTKHFIDQLLLTPENLPIAIFVFRNLFLIHSSFTSRLTTFSKINKTDKKTGRFFLYY
jgi:hypothetical protein